MIGFLVRGSVRIKIRIRGRVRVKVKVGVTFTVRVYRRSTKVLSPKQMSDILQGRSEETVQICQIVRLPVGPAQSAFRNVA